MAVNLAPLTELLPVAGIRLGIAEAGIKYPDRRDLVVVELSSGSTGAGVFTRNAFCAAPVTVAKDHLKQRPPRYLVINTGNANAGTGSKGMQDAHETCVAMAKVAGCKVEEVLPFSTGVIGEPLPLQKLQAGLQPAFDKLADNTWVDAAKGIMTTDTLPKGCSRQITLDGKTVTITGIAKGAGMIRPDMATMLAFIATDAQVDAALLEAMLRRAVDKSFNRITIDGDTSTNDACMLLATGKSGAMVSEGTAQANQLQAALNEVCQALAQAIVRDGEGATKFVEVRVEQGASQEECLQVGYTIAHSPLIKTALFASDPNWGRILAAIGRAGLEELELEAVQVYLNETCIVEQGGRAASYTEAAGQAAMRESEITIRVLLGRGDTVESVWTTDFSYDYVKINAEYRT